MDLPSSHIWPVGTYISPTHAPRIAPLGSARMVSSTGKASPITTCVIPSTWDADLTSLPGRPSLITSSSTLCVPLLHCQPSLPCGRLGCVRQPHNNHMPLQGPSWGRLPERLTQYVCSCLWTVLSHPKIHSGFIQITF